MDLKDSLSQQMGGKAKFWTGNSPVEYDALNQIRAITELPIVAGHIAVMPDVHLGKGATVGSVVPTKGAVIPSAVGVDIGCGMVAVQTSLKAKDLPESLKAVRLQIERDVPVGFDFHQAVPSFKGDGLSGLALERKYKSLMGSFDALSLFTGLGHFDQKRMTLQVGTLGGGNHFIEICLDQNQDVWIMLHSGSRNVGKTIGEHAMAKAKEHVATLDVSLKDKDLAWLSEGTLEFEQYVSALSWAQAYAALNREFMLQLTIRAIKKAMKVEFDLIGSAINSHHNYLMKERHFDEDLWITRKGAVSAQKGQMGIIPGSMGAKSFIVCGKGHEAAYCSCSHGAGRVMSRSKAKAFFTAEDVEKQTEGVECRKDEGVIDEIPAAYKDIDEVMANQAELVEIKHTLKQVLCVKG